MPETFQWLGAVQDALEDYYAETYRDTTKKFLAKNIPGKLLKEGILTLDMSRDTAINQALSYASLREKFAKDGASDPGNLASQAMLKKDKDTMSESESPKIVDKFEVTSFINDRGTGAIVDKETGLTATLSVQAHTNDPDVLFDAVEYVFAVARKLEATGRYEINPEVLQRDHRSAYYETRSELSGKGYSAGYQNMPDNNLPPSQMGNATPKHQSQNQPTGNEVFQAQIAQIELVATKDGKKTGYRVYRNHEYQGKHELKPIGFGDFRLQALEPVIKATGLSFANLPVGTKLPVNVQGLMAEYILEPQSDGKKFSKVVNYVLPNGERTVKAYSKSKSNAGDHGRDDHDFDITNSIDSPF